MISAGYRVTTRARLVASLHGPPLWLRALALACAMILIGNLFYHGAQPYAVGALRAPWDKVAHIVVHFVLGGAFWLALGARRSPIAVLLCALIAGADEAAQAMNPGRAIDVGDWLASLIGALLAVACGTLLRRSLRAYFGPPK